MTMSLAVSLVLIAAAAENLKVSETKEAPPKSVAAAIQKELAPTGYSVKSGDKAIANLWVRANVPTSAKAEPLTYDKLEEGTLIGIIEIKAEDLSDFRKQEFKPGVYTMRLGFQPQDGNHMGVAPAPEFLCLSPATDDTAADPVGHDDLMELSKKSLDTGHPAVLFMEPFSKKSTTEFPVVNTNESSHVVLNIKTKATLGDKKPAELPIGIILVGHTDAE